MADISASEIELLSKYILGVSGIKLDKSKAYLLENRLAPILKETGCHSFADLYHAAKKERGGHLEKEIVDAISTNETFFFRDKTPFDLLKNKIIPDIIDRRGQGNQARKIPLRIWSAACSTGQEVYSIAITLLEMLPGRDKFDISILGTDISSKAIGQASYGKYSKFEVERGLDPQKRQRYFTAMGNSWRVKDEVRSLATFKKINLMEPFTQMGKFDVVFCRNVAIYFKEADKMKLFRNIAKVMRPDGALLVGGSENLASIAPDFKSRQYLRGIYYELKGFKANRQPPKPAPKRAAPATPAARRPPVPPRPQTAPTPKRAHPPKEAPIKRAAAKEKGPTEKQRPDAPPKTAVADNQEKLSLSERLRSQTNGATPGGRALLGSLNKSSSKPGLLEGRESPKKEGGSLLSQIGRDKK